MGIKSPEMSKRKVVRMSGPDSPGYLQVHWRIDTKCDSCALFSPSVNAFHQSSTINMPHTSSLNAATDQHQSLTVPSASS